MLHNLAEFMTDPSSVINIHVEDYFLMFWVESNWFWAANGNPSLFSSGKPSSSNQVC